MTPAVGSAVDPAAMACSICGKPKKQARLIAGPGAWPSPFDGAQVEEHEIPVPALEPSGVDAGHGFLEGVNHETSIEQSREKSRIGRVHSGKFIVMLSLVTDVVNRGSGRT